MLRVAVGARRPAPNCSAPVPARFSVRRWLRARRRRLHVARPRRRAARSGAGVAPGSGDARQGVVSSGHPPARRRTERRRSRGPRARVGRALPEDLKGAARNNLGITLHRSGNTAEATRQFEGSARGRAGAAQATLNLAIALHERGEPARALPFYEQCLRMGGPRAEEVRGWVEGCRRIYR